MRKVETKEDFARQVLIDTGADTPENRDRPEDLVNPHAFPEDRAVWVSRERMLASLAAEAMEREDEHREMNPFEIPGCGVEWLRKHRR